MRSCPLCRGDQSTDYVFKSYVTCSECQHTYQPEPPPKTWQNQTLGECNGYAGATMDKSEKAANKYLASWIFEKYRPQSMLDIGCGYPYLSYCFQRLGLRAQGIDGAFKEGIIDNDLGVPTSPINWEDPDDSLDEECGGVELVTMIHVFEHFEDPIACLQRVFDNLSDDGIVYIRSPNKDVPGIERDHTEGHAAIHPNIFGSASFKYAIDTVGFHLVRQEHSPGYGQTSWVLRKRAPKVSLFMIVKNEEENIYECLQTIKDHCDEMIVLDTGSEDDTVAEAERAGALVCYSKFFGPETEIKDFHFGKARNEALSLVDPTSDWLVWLDADDRFSGSGLGLSPDLDGYNVEIRYGDMRLHHARIFRNGFNVQFRGAIHEYPTVEQCRMGLLQDAYVTHKTEDKPGRTFRNTTILEGERERNPDDKRTLFYLANSYRETNRLGEAIDVYQDYINRGGNFPDELFLAQYYLAMCYYALGQHKQAICEALRAVILDDRWAESYCCLGECYYILGDYKKSLSYLKMAVDLPLPQTGMFVRKELYDSVPKHWISQCYEQLGDLANARKWAKGTQRETELSKTKTVIEMCRPGALGDVLSTTPAVRELRKNFPDAHLRYVTHQGSTILKYNPDIDEVTETTGPCDRRIDFNYPMHEGYPDVPLTKHLAHYFADCAGVKLPIGWKPVIKFGPGDPVKLEHKKPVITFAVRTGWSRYKEWPLDRWATLIERFPQYQFIQLGAAGETQIEGAQYMCGKLSLRESFSVLQQSVLFVGLDSVFNHAAPALDVPAVIMFGSTSPQGSGYDQQLNLASGDECQPCYIEDPAITVHPKPPCAFAHKCMVDYMTVDRVAEAVNQKLNIQQEVGAHQSF